MEKLQLKDIAPYPMGKDGIKILLPKHQFKYDEQISLPLNGASVGTKGELQLEMLLPDDDLCFTHDIDINKCKLVLNPLLDLTKEIEVNGEKFVPIYVLFEMWCRNKKPEHQEYYIDESPNTIYCSHPSTAETFALTKYDLMYNYAWVINKLHEWHFDTNKLIEKGLAINKNTL